MQELTTNSKEYTSRPCYPELIAVILAGLLHVLLETLVSESSAIYFNGIVSIAFIAYLVWRGMRSKGVLRAWGMRRDNFWPALRAHLPFVIVSVIVVIGFGVVNNSLNLPRSFWFTIALYPIWGIAQQFALQNLIGRNLTALSSKPLVIAVVASLMFGVAHLPRLDLVALTLVAGIFLTLVYRRNPNLWAVGIVHGILGSMAFYIILKEDPGGVILRFLFGG